jgi:hypothetical protein
MNHVALQAYTQNLLRESAEILTGKGREYAGDDDRLSNFKRGAAATGVSPETVCLIYLTKHLDSIMSYVRDGKEGSEPIQGRIADLLNYTILLGALICERETQKLSREAAA